MRQIASNFCGLLRKAELYTSRVFEINGFWVQKKKPVHLKNVHPNETTGRTVDDVVLCHLLLVIFYVSSLAELTVIDLVYVKFWPSQAGNVRRR